MKNGITVENLKFGYRKDCMILDGIHFRVEPGNFTGIIGASGCGKSTLCHILCGIIPHAIGGELSGRAQVGELDLRKAQLRELAGVIGFVMQDPDRQIVTSTVEDELAFGPENLCVPPLEIGKRVDRILKLLGLEKMRFTDPNHLSGGQKQLVAIGSVLTLEPGILLLDEPYSHLDEKGKASVKEVLDQLREQKKTILVVEHDHSLIRDADQWILLEDGQIRRDGSPREVMKVV